MLKRWTEWATKRKVLLSFQLGLMIIFVANLLLGDSNVLIISGLSLVIISVLIMEEKDELKTE